MKIPRIKLFRKRSIWVPTWKMVVLTLLVGLGLFSLVISKLHGFLAQNVPLPDTRILIVEGWVSDKIQERVMEDINSGKYDRVYTTGTTIGRGGFLAEFGSYSRAAESMLEKLGAPEDMVIAAPCSDRLEHRTYGAAEGLVELLKAEGRIGSDGGDPLKLNLISEGVHSRRSLMAFRKAFGDTAEIGVYSLPPMGYDPKRWWKTGGSAKLVITETIAWTYEWLFDSGRD